MSLITQCPACATMFRIVPDQLRISEGWVRCGQCEEVFDANLHLSQLQERVPSPPKPAAPESAAAAPSAPVSWEPEPEALQSPPAPAPVPAPAPADEATPAPASPPEPPAEYDWSSVLSLPPAEALADTMLLPLDIPSVLPSSLPEPATEQAVDPLDSVQPGHQGTPDHDGAVSEMIPLSFMAPQASQAAGAGLPGGRWWWAGLCALLVLALGLQAMLHSRDLLAARAPALRPVLLSVCELLGCTLHAPQDIDAIAIDSSAFTSVRPGVYLLHVTLKSSSTMDLQMPALELTLSNAQDQALLRRVLQPADLRAEAVLAPGAEFSASLPMRVQTDAVGERIAGYKLLAFYP